MAVHIGTFLPPKYMRSLSHLRSLLVVNRGIKIGFHYDSLNHRNDEVAQETLGKISMLLNERMSPYVPRLSC